MSLIVGQYYRGNPKQKPKQWGSVSAVKSTILDNADKIYNIPPPNFYNPFWCNAGSDFQSIIGSGFNHRRGNPTWKNNRLYLNDNGHGTINDEIDSVASWDGSGDKTIILQVKQIGLAYANAYGGSTLLQNYKDTALGNIKIHINGDLNQHFFKLGNNAGHRHEGCSGVSITYGNMYLTAMRGNFANNTARCSVNNNHSDLSKVSLGWAGSTATYFNSFLLGTPQAIEYPYYGADAEYDFFMYIPAYLTDDQINHIYENPYALIQPPTFRAYFDFGSTASSISCNLLAAAAQATRIIQ